VGLICTEDGEDESQDDSRLLMVDGYTPLHWAVENGDLESVRMLLSNSVDVNIAASFDKHSGVTALHLASQVLLEHSAVLFVLFLSDDQINCGISCEEFLTVKYNFKFNISVEAELIGLLKQTESGIVIVVH